MSDKFTGSGPVKRAVIDTATGDTTLVAAVAGKKIRVISLVLSAAAEATIRFESGTGGDALTGQMIILAKTPLILPEADAGWFETAAATLLNLEQAATVALDGFLTYQEVP